MAARKTVAYSNEFGVNCRSSNNWRTSLVPAPAVIPAPIAYVKVVAVKTLVVAVGLPMGGWVAGFGCVGSRLAQAGRGCRRAGLVVRPFGGGPAKASPTYVSALGLGRFTRACFSPAYSKRFSWRSRSVARLARSAARRASVRSVSAGGSRAVSRGVGCCRGPRSWGA